MEVLALVGIPLAGVLGSLVGAWWTRRDARRARVGSDLENLRHELWEEEPRRRRAAQETIHELMNRGLLTDEQLIAASITLKHWAAVRWDLTLEQRRRLGVDGGDDGGSRG
ncbi:hypothetical protein [uncultured Friedmanniella sp.]|uniref:hypothetical protein n=1 Tax=uncultured Friedmanniella sp. TaxID=335381 RepID=UPI0035CAAE4B